MKIEDIHLETKDGVTTLRIDELVMTVQLVNHKVKPVVAGEETFVTEWTILDVLEPPEARAGFLKRK